VTPTTFTPRKVKEVFVPRWKILETFEHLEAALNDENEEEDTSDEAYANLHNKFEHAERNRLPLPIKRRLEIYSKLEEERLQKTGKHHSYHQNHPSRSYTAPVKLERDEGSFDSMVDSPSGNNSPRAQSPNPTSPPSHNSRTSSPSPPVSNDLLPNNQQQNHLPSSSTTFLISTINPAPPNKSDENSSTLAISSSSVASSGGSPHPPVNNPGSPSLCLVDLSIHHHTKSDSIFLNGKIQSGNGSGVEVEL